MIWTVERTTVEQIDLSEPEDGEIFDDEEAIEVAKRISMSDWQVMDTSYEAWEQQ